MNAIFRGSLILWLSALLCVGRVQASEAPAAPTLASQVLLPGLLKDEWKSSSFSSDGRALLVVDESRSFLFDVTAGRELRPVTLPAGEALIWSRPIPGTYRWIVVTSAGRLLELDGTTGKWSRILDLYATTSGRKYTPKTVSFEFISDAEIVLSALTRSETKRRRVTEITEKQQVLIVSIAGKKVLAKADISPKPHSFVLDSVIAVNAKAGSVALYSRSVSTLVTWRVDRPRPDAPALSETCVYDGATKVAMVEALASSFLVVDKEGKAFYLDASRMPGGTCTARLPADPGQSRCSFDLNIASIAGRTSDANQLIIVDRSFNAKRIAFSPDDCTRQATELGNVKVASMAAPIYTEQDAAAASSEAPSESFLATSLDGAPLMIANGNLLRLGENGAPPVPIQLLVGKPTGAFEIESGSGFLLASRLAAPLRVFDVERMRLRTINYDYRRFLDETFFYNKPFAIARKSGWLAVIERTGQLVFHEATGRVDTATMPRTQTLDILQPNALCLSDDGKRLWTLSEKNRLTLFELAEDRTFSRKTAIKLARLGDPFKVACAGDGQTVIVADSLTDFVDVVELRGSSRASEAVLVQELTIKASSDEIMRPSLSADGNMFAIGPRLFFRPGPRRAFSLVANLPGTERLVFDEAARQVLATGAKTGLYSIVKQRGKAILKKVRTVSPAALDGAFLGSDYLMLIRGTGEAEIVSLAGMKIGSLNFGDGRQWLFFDQAGRFDTDDIEGHAAGAWVMADSPMQALDPEIYMRDYLEPRLMPRLMNCRREEAAYPDACSAVLTPIRPVASLNRSRPVVTITKIEPDEHDRTVSVTIRVEGGLGIHGGEPGGVFDLHLRQDGQVVGRHPALTVPDKPTVTALDLNTWRDSHRIVDGAGSMDIRIPGIRLAGRDTAGKISFSAYAFNRDRVKGPTHHYAHAATPKQGAVRRRAFVVAVGTSAYEDSKMDLRYAARDARQFIDNVVPALARTGRFQEVIPLLLTSEWTAVAKAEGEPERRLTASDARKARIRGLIEAVSYGSPSRHAGAAAPDMPIERAGPDDTVLFFFSGHGLSAAGEFYFVPYDSGMKSTDPGAGPILQFDKLVSSTELSFWMRDLVADDIVLIVDACHSSASIETPDYKPGPMGSRGLGQLAYDKGMRVLASTRPNDLSWESQLTGQGLLTHALIEEGLRQGKADRRPTDGNISVGEWLEFGVDRVPELYVQTAEGRNEGDSRLVTFDVGNRWAREVSVNGARVQAGNQQPTVFSFRRRPESILDIRPAPSRK